MASTNLMLELLSKRIDIIAESLKRNMEVAEELLRRLEKDGK